MVQQKDFSNTEYTTDENILEPHLKHYGKNQKEQIKINQKSIELLNAWREKEENYTPQQLEAIELTWEATKKNIDKNRSRKLFP